MLIHGDIRVQQEPQMPESCTWALELFIGLQSLLLLPPSKHIRPQDTNNYMQLSVMIHSGPKAGIRGGLCPLLPCWACLSKWGVVRKSEIERSRGKERNKQIQSIHPSSSTLHISHSRYFLNHRGDFAHNNIHMQCCAVKARPTNKWNIFSVLFRLMTYATHGH